MGTSSEGYSESAVSLLSRTFDSREFPIAWFLFSDSRSPQAVNPIRVCPDLSNSGFALSFLFSRREAGCGGKMNDLHAPFFALARPSHLWFELDRFLLINVSSSFLLEYFPIF